MGNAIKHSLLWLGFCLFLVLTFTGGGWADEGEESYTIMKPDRETRLHWIQAFQAAPKAYMTNQRGLSIPQQGSFSLLSYLHYVPEERHQGSCGNCWAWAGTGVMEIALAAEEGIFDRLSVQNLNSCYGTGFNYPCCGGWLEDIVDFYSSPGYEQAIPWSNTNASWEDGGQTCGSGSSAVSCDSISPSPDYSIDYIEVTSISTHGVGQEQAIQHIKNILHQNKAVWFGYFLPTGADWTNFRDFWRNDGENVRWNPDFSCGNTWGSGGGGHAVLLVGYNDEDPNNRYWIILNSWGTDGGDRPNGLFRLDMDMNYDCTFSDIGGSYYSFYWQTLEIGYDTMSPPFVDIKANGSDGPIPISTEDTLAISVACDAGDDAGVDSDWWCLAKAPWGRWYHYDHQNHQWLPGFSVSKQGPLADLTYYEVLNKTGLATGSYTFYFGVDSNMNGLWDGTQYYDSVEVDITP
jgi:hypothetical protein